ncbi:helix-turn-helix domain-containing protein [Paenibacillus sp. YN15]|uniref:helix-turn-helix domain-containing protein n=1 Tax=Paenibacillus sp. YN15 TaxID=1742774 RepID=UPI000DCDA434|nr:helix-turn-helix domain-containing protein [Paenibacillus sp. YN15]RAV03097.1 hypothetical protein DQG13_08580 [Paenibacillus sp. YN15]
MDLKSIGTRIRSLRLGTGLSMKALAAKITEQTGVTISSGQISDWENGYKNPSAPGLIALSLYFQVSADWILKGNDIPEEQMELIRLFRELPDQDQAFVRRYIQLALLDKEISIPSRKSLSKLLRRTRPLSLKKLQAVREDASDYTLDVGRIIPLLGPEAASIAADWVNHIHGYLHVAEPLQHCFAIPVSPGKHGELPNADTHPRYAIVQPRESYEPGDLVAVRTTDGFAVEAFTGLKDALVIGKIISEVAPPSK